MCHTLSTPSEPTSAPHTHTAHTQHISSDPVIPLLCSLCLAMFLNLTHTSCIRYRFNISCIAHAVWIAGPGAFRLMIHIVLHCRSCCVMLTFMSSVLTMLSLALLILQPLLLSALVIPFTWVCARDTCLGHACTSLLAVSLFTCRTAQMMFADLPIRLPVYTC